MGLILFIAALSIIVLTLIFKNKETWSTLHIERKTITIDNREDPYYKKNGFHPYDTMCDIDVLHCEYLVQKGNKSGQFRVKHNGPVDIVLEKKAYKVMQKLIKQI